LFHILHARPSIARSEIELKYGSDLWHLPVLLKVERKLAGMKIAIFGGGIVNATKPTESSWECFLHFTNHFVSLF
jgi:hypothetical protein